MATKRDLMAIGAATAPWGSAARARYHRDGARTPIGRIAAKDQHLGATASRDQWSIRQAQGQALGSSEATGCRAARVASRDSSSRGVASGIPDRSLLDRAGARGAQARVRRLVRSYRGLGVGALARVHAPEARARRALRLDPATIAQWKRKTWPALKRTPRRKTTPSSS